jgi:hypothetical protein
MTVPQMGWLDFALLFPLAMVQLFATHYGEAIGPRIVISACLMGASPPLALVALSSSVRLKDYHW